MKKEIGGYPSQELYNGQEYHTNEFRLNSVRNAIVFITEAAQYKKLYIPYLLCDSVWKKLEAKDIGYEFYHIDDRYFPILQPDHVKKNEGVLIVNYYGIFGESEIETLQKKYNNLIIDNTHDFFSEYDISVDVVYNCRKYFGVTDGAYVKCNKPDMVQMYRNLPMDSSSSRYLYLLKRFEEGASSGYSLFREQEKKFEKMPIAKMSLITKNVLSSLKYDDIKKRRTDNFSYLHIQLQSEFYKNTYSFKKGTYMYPYVAFNARQLREKLIKAKIYVPIFWTDVLKQKGLNDVENNFVKNVLPLPIDHRYEWKDMQYIVNQL